MNNLTICDVFEYAGDIPLFAREVLGVKLTRNRRPCWGPIRGG